MYQQIVLLFIYVGCHSRAYFPTKNRGANVKFSVFTMFVSIFFRLLKKVVVDIGATVVFVATDRDPLFSEIQQHLAEQKASW